MIPLCKDRVDPIVCNARKAKFCQKNSRKCGMRLSYEDLQVLANSTYHWSVSFVVEEVLLLSPL
jgi:hypothetical protein